MRGKHHLAPNLGGKATAHHVIHRAPVVVAGPDPGRHLRRVANKPGVAIVLRGSGLAGRGMARQSSPAARARYQSRVEHLVHCADVGKSDDRLGGLRLALVEDAAGAREHAAQHVGLCGVTAVGENVVSAGELEQRDLGGAERKRGVLAERRRDPQPARDLGNARWSHLQRQTHGDRIHRPRQRRAQGHGAAVLAAAVARRPAADAERQILDDAVGLQARFHGRQIDERLEGRARLTVCHDSAVELARRMVTSADKGADAAMLVEHDNGGLACAQGLAALIEPARDD